jgi:hypothetical protein
MLNANVWNKNSTDMLEHTDVRLTSAGVLIGDGPEVLIPWHRVHEVWSDTRGAIELELSGSGYVDC